MKQTVTILTALMVALLLVSGFIVMGSVQQSELLIQREDQLLAQTQQMDEQLLAMEKLEREAERSAQLVKQLTQERDALNQQLSDAVLASQEANDAVAQQVSQAQSREAEMEALANQLAQAQSRNAELEAALAKAEDEAAITAMAYEQQAAEDAQQLEKLQAELQEALKPTPTPSPKPSPTPSPTFATLRPPLPMQ